MVRWLILILLSLCTLACSDRAGVQGDSIFPTDIQLHVGDVVFRQGAGFTSHVVRMAEGGGVYSHVGIVVDSADVLMIVHAVPDEPEYEGDVDRVKMERPEAFFSRVRAHQGAVCRHLDSRLAREAAHYAVQTYRRRTLFDHDYDDNDTTKMYCTEFVTHVFRKTGHPLTGFQRHHLRLVGFEADCVLPSDLLHCRELKQITTF